MFTTLYNKKTRALIGHSFSSDQSHKIENEDFGHIDGQVADMTMWVDEDLTLQPSTVVPVITTKVDLNSVVNIPVPQGAWVDVSGILQVALDGNIRITSSSVQTINYRLVGKYRSDFASIHFLDMSDYKLNVKSKIDADAEVARAYTNTGQAATYIQKAEAAKLVLAGEPLTDIQQEWMDTEASRQGITIQEAAQKIIDASAASETFLVRVDIMRLAKKAEVDSSPTYEEVDAVYAGISWPTN